MKSRIWVAATAVACFGSAAFADGRIWAQDASGAYNGSDGSGGAFVMQRIGSSFSGTGTFGQSTDGYHTAQNDAGNVGGGLGQQGLGADAFHTFCLERSETVSLGNSNTPGNRYFAEIASSAKNGGNINDPTNTDSAGDVAGEDQLSYATAAVYQEFRNNGNFGGVGSIGINGADFTSAIQWAIWYLEGEMTIGEMGIASIRNFVVGADGIDGGNSDTNGIVGWARNNNGGTLGNVRVLRLWTSITVNSPAGYSGNSQDMLVLIPLPSTAALAGLGLLGIGARVRRRAF
jgi:hypothetical protein